MKVFKILVLPSNFSIIRIENCENEGGLKNEM